MNPKKRLRAVYMTDAEYEDCSRAACGNFTAWASSLLVAAARREPPPPGALLGGACGDCGAPGARHRDLRARVFLCAPCAALRPLGTVEAVVTSQGREALVQAILDAAEALRDYDARGYGLGNVTSGKGLFEG